MRWVLDTNVVASALLWDGAPKLLLRAAHEGRFTPFTSPPMLAEPAHVLSRTKFQPKTSAASLSVDQIVNRYAALASVVRPLAVPRLAPDPDDDVVIATALAANADCVVTGDRSLLSVAEYVRIGFVSKFWALSAAPVHPLALNHKLQNKSSV